MRAKRTDANLTDLVKALRKLGYLVNITNADWDLTVVHRGKVLLLEVKDPKSPNLKRRNKGDDLRDLGWPIHKVMTLEEVLKL